VRGTASAVSAAFGTHLEVVSSRAPDGRTVTHRQRTGALSVPAELADRVLAVLGIDDRPQARSQFRLAAAAHRPKSYTPVQLGQVYAFPADTDGSGQSIAIIELGGGFGMPDDVDASFAFLVAGLVAGLTGLAVSSPA